MLCFWNVAMHYCANVKNVACYKSRTLWNNNFGECQDKFVTLHSEKVSIKLVYIMTDRKDGYNHCETEL